VTGCDDIYRAGRTNKSPELSRESKGKVSIRPCAFGNHDTCGPCGSDALRPRIRPRPQNSDSVRSKFWITAGLLKLNAGAD
jgi:hypothetical protein